MTNTTEPIGRLTALVDRNLAQLPSPAPEQTSRGLAASLTAVRSWLDEPNITWATLRLRVHAALQAAIEAHRASAPGNENIPAYARADGLSGVQSWMSEIEGSA